MKLYAYAKINLSLFLTGTKDGLHLLDSIMLTCKDLKDTIIIRKSNIDSLDFFGTQTDKIDINNNTVKKALDFFRNNTKIYTPLCIKVIKTIPVMAGLGGSSADAACLLRGLSKMFGLKLDSKEVLDAAKNTGSDVPYMLKLHAARVSGTGDKIEIIKNKTKLYTVIAMDGEVSTKKCFDAFDSLKCPYSDKSRNDRLVKALCDNDYINVVKNIKNDLYDAAVAVNLNILHTQSLLQKTHADIVCMTGSGGAFFALTSKKRLQKNIYDSLNGKAKYIFKTSIF